jgi:hypothetical protein
MRAHYELRCECCKAPIPSGVRYLIMFGRPWLPQHALAYRRRKIA